MSFEIAIPSYNRQKIIKNKTLRLLNNYGFPKKRITIFLESVEMKDLYKEEIGDYNYVITGQKGIMATRNFLRVYYREQTKTDFVLFIDDDIEKFQKECVDVIDFESTINYFFFETKIRNLNLFAVSPYNNKLFLKDKITTNLAFCFGAFQGEIINRKKHLILCDVEHGEDFQFTMEYFLRDGGVVRFNGYNIITKYFSNGGINESLGGKQKRLLNMEENAYYLQERYDGMCVAVKKKYGVDCHLNTKYSI